MGNYTNTYELLQRTPKKPGIMTKKKLKQI